MTHNRIDNIVRLTLSSIVTKLSVDVSAENGEAYYPHEGLPALFVDFMYLWKLVEAQTVFFMSRLKLNLDSVQN